MQELDAMSKIMQRFIAFDPPHQTFRNKRVVMPSCRGLSR